MTQTSNYLILNICQCFVTVNINKLEHCELQRNNKIIRSKML